MPILVKFHDLTIHIQKQLFFTDIQFILFFSAYVNNFILMFSNLLHFFIFQTQFFILFVYVIQGLSPNCSIVADWFTLFILFNIFMNIVLFTNFYLKNYFKKSKSH